VTAPAPGYKSMFCCGDHIVQLDNTATGGNINISIPGDELVMSDFLPNKAYLDNARNSCLIEVEDATSGISDVFAVFSNGRMYGDNPAQLEIISNEKFTMMNDASTESFTRSSPASSTCRSLALRTILHTGSLCTRTSV